MCQLAKNGTINTDHAGLVSLCKELSPCLAECQLARDVIYDIVDCEDLPPYVRCYAARSLAPVLESDWYFHRVLSLLAEDEEYLIVAGLISIMHSSRYNDLEAIELIAWCMIKEDLDSDLSCTRQIALRCLARPIAEGNVKAVEAVTGHLLHGDSCSEVIKIGLHVLGHALLACHPESEMHAGISNVLGIYLEEDTPEVGRFIDPGVRQEARKVMRGEIWPLRFFKTPLH